ncbi:uncharacterized protein MELLADRAFT_95666 [Melampsora larici-populina 98AG31]|uniref:GCM domain-containing protein n=1 Tax=Melampsora larici-populina (strain 98AG31 / pathotype 3-4-7) TaxID=747676 RepID=F4SA63_MELLP|nr:uncharacterized protein MELLADRAFT_95666 [Melampsora larici-populina 98AG31]EGF98492.1 hypothetical protein MELLADRAFT_95666 [Melampsora larici-populina 98AG31]
MNNSLRANCSELVRHVACEDTICRLDEHIPSGWGIIRHSGDHTHAWPRRNKPDKYSMKRFAERVTNNPSMGPLQHKLHKTHLKFLTIPGWSSPCRNTGYHIVIWDSSVVGKPAPYCLLPTQDTGRCRGYPREEDTRCRGQFPFGDDSLGKDIHMTFQTQWMADQLLTREIDGGVYRGGLLSDVTYKFFANGYLMTTSMYHSTLRRWIPIQLTWLYGLSEEHYFAHFNTLMKQIKKAQLLPEERDTLVRQVVDFSAAQKNGFIRAYMKVFDCTDRKEALGKLKGCQEHFRQQVTRLKKNHKIVPLHLQEDWVRLTECLLHKDVPGKDTYEQNVQTLRRLFPAAKRWLDWWQASDIEAMLFRSRRKQIDDDGLCDDLPDTTNAQESMHRVYYMIAESNCTIQIGLVQLYAFVKSLERDHEDLLRGVSIEYGSTRNYEKVATTLGWTKKNRNRKDKHNDGRPPDTTQALLGRKKKLGRPVGSVNINRNPITTFQGFYASSEAGRRNRCWLDSIAECLHAIQSPLWFHGTNGKATHIYTKIMKVLSSRATCEMTEKGSIRAILSQGQNTIHAAAQAASVSFPTDQFASADTFFEVIFDCTDKRPLVPAPARTLFRLARIQKLVCSRDSTHRINKTIPTNTISILPQHFDSDFNYSQTPKFLATWMSETGIRGQSNRHCQRCTKDDTGLPPFFERNRLAWEQPDMDAMMAECDLPYQLEVYGVKYWMRTRGYWDGAHFWCKVIRTVQGLTAVWYHNDMLNGGNASLISTDLQDIGGPSPKTSWAMYSRQPTADESVIIEEAKDSIKQMDKSLVLDGNREGVKSLLASLTPEEIEDMFASDGNTEEENCSKLEKKEAKPKKKAHKKKSKAYQVLTAEERALDDISDEDKHCEQGQQEDGVESEIEVVSSKPKGRMKSTAKIQARPRPVAVVQTKDPVSKSKTNDPKPVTKKLKGWKGYEMVAEGAVEESHEGEEEPVEQAERGVRTSKRKR